MVGGGGFQTAEYGILPGLPDDYSYEVIQTPARPLLNAQPLRIQQASLSDVPMVVWVLLGLAIVVVGGIFALAISKK